MQIPDLLTEKELNTLWETYDHDDPWQENNSWGLIVAHAQRAKDIAYYEAAYWTEMQKDEEFVTEWLIDYALRQECFQGKSILQEARSFIAALRGRGWLQ